MVIYADRGRAFVVDNNSLHVVLWVIKAGTELIEFNYKPWVADRNYLCPPRNLCQIESVHHFKASRLVLFKKIVRKGKTKFRRIL